MRFSIRLDNPASEDARIPWLPLLGIAGIAAALRLIGLGASPIWFDELITATGVERPLLDCFTQPGSYVNPPLFYGITAVFDRLGESMFFLRLPSAISGVVSVVLVGAIASRVFGSRAALFAAALLAVSAFDVRFSREARMYTMLGVATLATMMFTHLALSRGRWWDWVGLAVSLAAAMWIHYIAAPLAICVALRIGVELMARSGTSASERRRLLRAATVTGVAAMVLVAPTVPMFVEARAYQGGVGETITTGAPWLQPAVIWSHFAGYAKSIESWPFARPIFAGVAFVLAVGFTAGIVRLANSERAWMRTLVAFTVLPAAASLVYFAFANPVQMTSRYQSFLFPGVALVCGIGLASIRPRRFALVALAVVLVANAAASVHAIRTPVRFASGWEEALGTLAGESRTGDRFLSLPDYYGKRYATYFGSGAATRVPATALRGDVIASLDAYLVHDGAVLWVLVLDPYDDHVKQRQFERDIADALVRDARLAVAEDRVFGDVRLLRLERDGAAEVFP